jgi:succinoglycan biosynthesis transport protein ExoP
MQPNESFSITRRSLDVEDYIDILRRHRGWIFGPFLLCTVASVVGVFLWPDSYVSEAMIKITPQQVPESLVPTTINQQMWDRITSMEQTILSRSVLTTIIQNNGLYKSQLARMPISDVVELMHGAIHVNPVSPGGNNRIIPAFAITFSYSDAHLAQRVVSDLVGKFIDQNTRDRTNATFANARFMQDETERAKKSLDEVENRLAEFQLQNNGHLPDQADANTHSLMAAEAQLTSLSGRISSANSEKLQLESSLRILKDQQTEISKQTAEAPITYASVQRNERLTDADREVEAIENGLRVLRQKYGESHPDVQNAVGRLALAKQKRDEILKEDAAKKDDPAANKKPDPAPVSRPNPALARDLLERDGRIKQLQSQIEAKNLDIEELNREVKHANDAIRTYQGLLSSVPIGAKTYTDLLRDREMAKQKYVDLDDRLSRAKRSEEMESQHLGEQLEPLDPASLPTDPTEPKRPLVIAIGSGIGLLLGVVIAGAREMKDTSLKNLKDVRAYTQMAVLGSIPLLENDFVVRRRRRLAWLGWTTTCLAAVVVMVGAIVYYYSTRGGGVQ